MGKNSDSFSNDIVTEILEDQNGELWIATLAGLIRFDSSRERMVRYQHDDANPHSLAANNIRRLIVDRQGILWLGIREGGLNRLLPRSKYFVQFNYDPADSDSLSHILNLMNCHR